MNRKLHPATLAVLVSTIGMAILMGACQSNPLESPAGLPEAGPSGATTAIDPSLMLDLALCAPERHRFTIEVNNVFFPLPVGRTWDFRGMEEGNSIRTLATVFDLTERVGSVSTRVLEERHWENGELIEVSRNYFAQTEEGTVCYFGEAVDLIEDGVIVAHTGAWRADDPGQGPGIYMVRNPRVGMSYLQEDAPGVAEDAATVIARGETVEVRVGTFDQTIRTEDVNLLDGDRGEKVYAKGIGLLIDGGASLVRMIK